MKTIIFNICVENECAGRLLSGIQALLQSEHLNSEICKKFSVAEIGPDTAVVCTHLPQPAIDASPQNLEIDSTPDMTGDMNAIDCQLAVDASDNQADTPDLSDVAPELSAQSMTPATMSVGVCAILNLDSSKLIECSSHASEESYLLVTNVSLSETSIQFNYCGNLIKCPLFNNGSAGAAIGVTVILPDQGIQKFCIMNVVESPDAQCRAVLAQHLLDIDN